MKNRLFVLLLFIIPLFTVSADLFTAAGVQFEISPALYRSRDAFFSKVEHELESILEAEPGTDLIIFPEYIGVFYQLIDYNRIINGRTTFQEALAEVLKEYPELKSMKDIFADIEPSESYLDSWSQLADKYDVYIISGTCFVNGENGGLFNRAHVYDPSGKLLYKQDKVFLTEFETDIIGLAPGSLKDADFFRVNNINIALTICRDAYSHEWESKNSGAFLWVDIKANGEIYDEYQRRSFMRALPARMMNSDVPLGMTVCAVGSYLDLFWEGESSVLVKNDGKLYLTDISKTADQEDLILLKLDGNSQN